MVEPGLVVGIREGARREPAHVLLRLGGGGPGPVAAFAVLVPVRLTPTAFRLSFPDQGFVHDPGQSSPKRRASPTSRAPSLGRILIFVGSCSGTGAPRPSGPQGAPPCGRR